MQNYLNADVDGAHITNQVMMLVSGSKCQRYELIQWSVLQVQSNAGGIPPKMPRKKEVLAVKLVTTSIPKTNLLGLNLIRSYLNRKKK